MTERAVTDFTVTEQLQQLSETARDSLRTKIILAVIGPNRVGKTSLLRVASQLEPELFHVVEPVIATPDEHSKIQATRPQNNEITWLARRPNSDLCGIRVGECTGRYNLIEVRASDVGGIRQLPAEYHMTISVSAPVCDWRQRFTAAKYTPRETNSYLDDSVQDLNWAFRDSYRMWLSNPSLRQTLSNPCRGLHAAAERLIRMAVGDEYSSGQAEQEAQGILSSIPDMRPAIGRAS